MPSCMAKNCNSGRAKDPPNTRVVVYRFPKSVRISNRWIRGLRRGKWTPKPSSVLCSLHFEEDCFMPGTFNDPMIRPKLKPNAVPTIFDYNKKKKARKLPKNRTTPEEAKNSSLLLSLSENEQNVEMATSQDDSGIIAGGSNNDAKTSSSAGKPNLIPISSENLQDLEMIASPDDSGVYFIKIKSGDTHNAPETICSAVKDPVPQTPTPVTPGTSRASFFQNLNHSYVVQTETNPEIKTGKHAYCAQAEPNPEIKAGPTRVTAPNDQSSAMEFDALGGYHLQDIGLYRTSRPVRKFGRF